MADLRYVITARGIGVVLTAVLVFLLAGFTRVGWLLLSDSVLWGVIAVSLLMPWLAMGRLVAHRRVIGWDGDEAMPGPTEGQEVRFSIALKNEGLLPAAFATLDYKLGPVTPDGSRSRMFIAWLGRGGRTSATVTAAYPKRGRLQLEPLEAQSSAPFGLFRRRRQSGEPTDLLVLPRLYSIDAPALLGMQSYDERASMMARVGEQAAGSRSYVPGDPWQHIHWRNTARVGQVQLREFETDSGRSITVCFDASTDARRDSDDDDVLEDSVRIAASICVAACSSGGIVRVLAGPMDLATGEVGRHLEALALLRRGGWATVAENLSKVRAGTVFAIVSQSDGRGLDAARELAERGAAVTVISMRGYLGASEEVSATGVTPAESGLRTLVCRPGGVGAALAAVRT